MTFARKMYSEALKRDKMCCPASKLRKQHVILSSVHTRQMGCNPKALFAFFDNQKSDLYFKGNLPKFASFWGVFPQSLF